MAIWKAKLKTEHCLLLQWSYQPIFFSIVAIHENLLGPLPILLFNTHRVGNKFQYSGLYIKWANASSILIRDTLPTLNLPIKRHQSSR